jgi:hypothetical protein
MNDRYRRIANRFLHCDPQTWSAARQRLAFECKRPFKRILFWLASGRDLDRFDPLHLSFRRTSGRCFVDDSLFAAGGEGAVILGFGQSNIANEGEASALHQPKGEVYNFNFFNGRCYVAKDPLLGASIDRGNVLTRLGELLVERGNYRRVLLVPIAHGGTYASEWSPGGRMFPRLQWTLERLRERRIGITHVLWQQGEAEAATSKPSAEDWMHHFRAMAGAIRTAGTDAPIYVSQSTVCCNDPNETIRAAQRQVVDPQAGIRAGPDTDQIGRDERFDGCHFSAAGLRHAAELWYEALCRAE